MNWRILISMISIVLFFGCSMQPSHLAPGCGAVPDPLKQTITRMLSENLIARNEQDLAGALEMYHPDASIEAFWEGKKQTTDVSGMFRALPTIFAERERNDLRFNDQLELKEWQQCKRVIRVKNISRYTLVLKGVNHKGVDEESFDLRKKKKSWRVIKHRYQTLSFQKVE